MSEEKLQLDEKLWQIKAGPLAAEDVALILLNPAEFPAQLIEELSLKTALLYWYGKIEFIDGDWIMNNLFGFWSNGLPGNPDFPKAAWDCFSAFDEGEFYHTEDDRNVDPEEKYTRPLLEKLLQSNKLI
jgi:hypothetical protein